MKFTQLMLAAIIGALIGKGIADEINDKREAERTDARLDEWMKEAKERCDRINHANGVPGY